MKGLTEFSLSTGKLFLPVKA